MRTSLYLPLVLVLACASQTPSTPTAVVSAPDAGAASTPAAETVEPAQPSLKPLLNEYVVGFLGRNPVVATYLGGSELDPALAEVDGKLRNHSAAALAEEDSAPTSGSIGTWRSRRPASCFISILCAVFSSARSTRTPTSRSAASTSSCRG